VDVDRRGDGVLGGVLDGLQRAEVRRGLDVDREPGGAAPHDLDAVPRGRPQRPRHAGLLEARRVDAPRELEQRGHGVLGRFLLGSQQRLGTLGCRDSEVRGEPQVDRERDQVLLGTVVDVALEPLPGLVLGVDQPPPGAAQLLLPDRQLAQPALERCAQPGAAQHQASLAGQIGEEPFFDRRERRSGPLAEDQYPELLVSVTNR
jgi:hypothetical protein